jgi:hypothetical protein
MTDENKIAKYNIGDIRQSDEDDPTIFCQLINIDGEMYWMNP